MTQEHKDLFEERNNLIIKNQLLDEEIEDLKCEIEILEVLMALQNSQKSVDNLKSLITKSNG